MIKSKLFSDKNKTPNIHNISMHNKNDTVITLQYNENKNSTTNIVVVIFILKEQFTSQ